MDLIRQLQRKIGEYFQPKQKIISPLSDIPDPEYNTDLTPNKAMAYWMASEKSKEEAAHKRNLEKTERTTPTPEIFNTSRQQVLSAKDNYISEPTIKPIFNYRVVTPTLTPTPIPKDKRFIDFTTTPIPQQHSDLIYNSAKKSGIDPNMLASLLFSESGFNPKAINKNSTGSIDRGISQINNLAHPDITDEQAYDPNFAIPWTANLLSNHIKNLGDINKAIAAYNLGAGGASDPERFKTLGQRYINKIAKGLSPALRKKLGIKLIE